MDWILRWPQNAKWNQKKKKEKNWKRSKRITYSSRNMNRWIFAGDYFSNRLNVHNVVEECYLLRLKPDDAARGKNGSKVQYTKIQWSAIQNGMLFKMRNSMYCTMQPQTVYIASCCGFSKPTLLHAASSRLLTHFYLCVIYPFCCLLFIPLWKMKS